MVGQYTSLISRPARKSGLGSSALKVKRLQGPSGLDIRDLTVHRNQIVGLAGLGGAGRTTFLNVLFGSLRGRGEVELFGRPYFPKQPRAAIRKGPGLVPENRKTEGLVLDAEIYKNTLLPSLRGRFCAAGNRWKGDAGRILVSW
jgi:ribose transport system ATP-binding protein